MFEQKLKIYSIFIFVFIIFTFLFKETLNYNFISDDNIIFSNKNITNLLSFKEYFKKQGSFTNIYRPISDYLRALEYKYFNKNTKYYRIINFIIHFINTILIYIFINHLIKNKLLSIISSIFFLFSVAILETVIWIKGFSDILSTTFFLIGMLLYFSNKRYNHYLSLFIFLIMMFTKEFYITFPVILIIYDFLFRKNIIKKQILLYIIGFCISIGYIVIRANIIEHSKFILHNNIIYALFLGLKSYLFYFFDSIYYYDLYLFRNLTKEDLFIIDSNFIILLIIFFTINIFILLQKNNGIKFLLFIFLIILFPVSNTLFFIYTGYSVTVYWIHYIYMLSIYPVLTIIYIFYYYLYKNNKFIFYLLTTLLLFINITQLYYNKYIYKDNSFIATNLEEMLNNNHSYISELSLKVLTRIYNIKKDYINAYKAFSRLHLVKKHFPKNSGYYKDYEYIVKILLKLNKKKLAIKYLKYIKKYCIDNNVKKQCDILINLIKNKDSYINYDSITLKNNIETINKLINNYIKNYKFLKNIIFNDKKNKNDFNYTKKIILAYKATFQYKECLNYIDILLKQDIFDYSQKKILLFNKAIIYEKNLLDYKKAYKIYLYLFNNEFNKEKKMLYKSKLDSLYWKIN